MFRVFKVFKVLKVFRVFRVFRAYDQCGVPGVGWGLGFGRTKTTRNVTWCSNVTPCQKKKLKTVEKLKFGQK